MTGGPFDTLVTPPVVIGSHAYFEVTVPVSVAEGGHGLATCRKVAEMKNLRFMDAQRVDVRTWLVKVMAPPTTGGLTESP